MSSSNHFITLMVSRGPWAGNDRTPQFLSPSWEDMNGGGEGVTQTAADGSNHWGLESSGSSHTSTFAACAGMAQQLVSAQTVDGSIRRPLPGA